MSKDNGVKPSNVDPSLPDNKAEKDAMKDAEKMSKKETEKADKKARESNRSLMNEIFGGGKGKKK